MAEIKNVYLIGFMCSGKTTVGKLLAAKLGRKFADTDELVEKSRRRSCSRIIKEEGLSRFRRDEEKVFAGIAKRSGLVAALGGGFTLSQKRRAALRKKSVVVYLSCRAETLAERLFSGGKTRPLIGSGGKSAVLQKVNRLLSRRLAGYEKADIIVSAEKKPSAVAGEIIAQL